MRLYFIRHAEAVEADAFAGPDLRRPLTPDGKKSARKTFKALRRTLDDVDVIVVSEARRAIQTGEVLAQALRVKTVRITKHLNPGATVSSLGRVLRSLPKAERNVALVGHEPDFSSIISSLVAGGRLRIRVRKASCVGVELETTNSATLLFAIPPAKLTA